MVIQMIPTILLRWPFPITRRRPPPPAVALRGDGNTHSWLCSSAVVTAGAVTVEIAVCPEPQHTRRDPPPDERALSSNLSARFSGTHVAPLITVAHHCPQVRPASCSLRCGFVLGERCVSDLLRTIQPPRAAVLDGGARAGIRGAALWDNTKNNRGGSTGH